MASDVLAGVAGLGEGLGQFGNALVRMMERKAAQARADRKRERGLLMDRVELVATPGVSLGSPPEMPMRSGPSSEVSLGEREGAIRGGVEGFTSDTSSAGVSLADSGGLTGGLARTIAGAETPEVPSGTATRLGELGGQDVFYDPVAARRATSDPEKTPWEEKGFGSREEYLAFLSDKQAATSAGGGGRDTRPNIRGYEVPVDPLEDPEGYADAVGSIERPIYEARAEARGEGDGAAQGDRPTFPQMRDLIQDQLYAPNEMGKRTPVAPLTPERELNIARIGTRDPEAARDSIARVYEEATAPPDTASAEGEDQGGGFFDALKKVGGVARRALPGGEPLFRSSSVSGGVPRSTGGSTYDPGNAPDTTGARRSTAEAYGHDPARIEERRERLRAMEARPDSAAADSTGTGDTPPEGLEVPRERVRQVVEAFGSIPAAIDTLEGLPNRNAAEEALLERLRQLQGAGYRRGGQ